MILYVLPNTIKAKKEARNIVTICFYEFVLLTKHNRGEEADESSRQHFGRDLVGGEGQREGGRSMLRVHNREHAGDDLRRAVRDLVPDDNFDDRTAPAHHV